MNDRRHTECDVHLVPIDSRRGCPYCLRFLAAAPDPQELSSADRLDELERWLLSERSVPPGVLLARIEQLVGRPVMPWELEEPDMLMRRAQRPRRQDGYWDDW
jgi:hypothetical protein